VTESRLTRKASAARTVEVMPMTEARLTRMEDLLYSINEKVGRIDERSNKILDHDIRLRTMETKQDRSTGAHSVLGAVFGMVGGAIAGYFGKHF
jgi:hypothetical protein